MDQNQIKDALETLSAMVNSLAARISVLESKTPATAPAPNLSPDAPAAPTDSSPAAPSAPNNSEVTNNG